MGNYFEEFDRQVEDELGINEGRLNRWVEHRVTAALKQADVFYEYETRKLREVLDKVKKENERLREALKLIADDYCGSSECRALEKQCDRCIARAALEGKV